MLISQFMGIMPLINILSNDMSKARFKWTSPQVIYSIICCICLICYDILTVLWLLKVGFEFSRCSTTIFYTSNILAMISFLRLAMLWPKILRRWQASEDLMSPLFKERSHRILKRKIIILAITIMTCSVSK